MAEEEGTSGPLIGVNLGSLGITAVDCSTSTLVEFAARVGYHPSNPDCYLGTETLTKRGMRTHMIPFSRIRERDCQIQSLHWPKIERLLNEEMVREFQPHWPLEMKPDILLSSFNLCRTVKDKVRLAGILIEGGHFQSLQIKNSSECAVLSPILYHDVSEMSSKDSLVCVLDCGFSSIRAVCMRNNREMRGTLVERRTLGSQKITLDLVNRLNSNQIVSFVTMAEMRIGDDIKRTQCFIETSEVSEEVKKSVSKYELPDGQVIDLDYETRVSPTESLFSGDQSMQNLILESVKRSGMMMMIRKKKKDVSTAKSRLTLNVLCIGGSSHFKNFRLRLQKELTLMDYFKDWNIQMKLDDSTQIPIDGTGWSELSYMDESVFAYLAGLFEKNTRVSGGEVDNWVTPEKWTEFGSSIVLRY